MFSWPSFATCRNPRAAASRPAPSGRGCGTLPASAVLTISARSSRVGSFSPYFLRIASKLTRSSPFSVGGQLGARRIVGNGVLAFRNLVHLVCRHVEERCVRINEMRDQPWTCDPIHFRLLPRHPFHASPPIGESLGR